MRALKSFPVHSIDTTSLLGENNSNLKDFNLANDGNLIAESDDPWIYYSLPEPINVKTVNIMVDSVSLQNTWAQLHFILQDGS